jgi:hypothetical protein
LERALIQFDPPNDRELRFHFTLDDSEAAATNQFQYFTRVFQQDGDGTRFAQVELLMNDHLIETADLTVGDTLISTEFSASDVFAGVGENTLTLRLTGGTAQWMSFDYHQMRILEVHEPGDTDYDCDVDFTDFNNLANNYTGSLDPGTGGKLWEQGDFDGDADVDFADFNELANHYTGPGSGCKGTPEPSAIALLSMGAIGLAPYALRRRTAKA